VIDNGNVFEVLMDAVRCCSLGQITNALFEVGGQYRRNMWLARSSALFAQRRRTLARTQSAIRSLAWPQSGWSTSQAASVRSFSSVSAASG